MTKTLSRRSKMVSSEKAANQKIVLARYTAQSCVRRTWNFWCARIQCHMWQFCAGVFQCRCRIPSSHRIVRCIAEIDVGVWPHCHQATCVRPQSTLAYRYISAVQSVLAGRMLSGFLLNSFLDLIRCQQIKLCAVDNADRRPVTHSRLLVAHLSSSLSE